MFNIYIRLIPLFLITLLWTLPCSATKTLSVLQAATANPRVQESHQAIVNAIALRLGRQVFFRTAPFKRSLLFMKNGTIDIMVGLLRRPEREAYIHYISPPYKRRSDTVFFLRSHHPPDHITTYEDLRAKHIGTLTGARYFPAFDADTTLLKEPTHNFESNIRKLILGRLDVVVSSETTGIEWLHKIKLANHITLADFRYAKVKNVYVGISKKSELMAELPQVEGIIKGMILGGEIHGVIVDYYTQRNLPVPAI